MNFRKSKCLSKARSNIAILSKYSRKSEKPQIFYFNIFPSLLSRPSDLVSSIKKARACFLRTVNVFVLVFKLQIKKKFKKQKKFN